MSVSADVNDELSRLRDQVNQLMKDRVNPALHDAASQARDFGEDNVARISGRVREQPFAALAIAAGIGFLLGRSSK